MCSVYHCILMTVISDEVFNHCMYVVYVFVSEADVCVVHCVSVQTQTREVTHTPSSESEYLDLIQRCSDPEADHELPHPGLFLRSVVS